MKSILVIGIVLAGVIGGIAIFASIDSETWQDKRTGTIGVALPDEIDERVNCMSGGGTWDVRSCNNPKPVEQENPDVQVQSINDFEQCIAAGNPAMESYPRQCRTIDGHFVEIIDEPSCDPSYPDVCVTPYPIDLDCDEISYSNFKVIGSDPHGFDDDYDGIGCEVGSPDSSNTVDIPSCDPSYPDVCIAVYPPDLNCGEIGYSNFKVDGSDPHGFDRDRDGIGCES